MTRDLGEVRGWVTTGTRLLLEATDGLDEAAYDEPTALPGWTRRHVVSHVAANAEALGNLVAWAATGVPTPMYPSPEARTAGIEAGLRLSAAELGVWLRNSAEQLEAAMSALPEEHWAREVVTAQGRTVTATETPWLRAREVCVHAVDVDAGVGFADLPSPFLRALCAEILTRRGRLPAVEGPLDQVTAWLSGRVHHLDSAPRIGPWL